MDALRDGWLAAARAEYGEEYESLRLAAAPALRAAEEERRALLAALVPPAELGCDETKLDCRDLSPGCRACAAGTWSCLFVNGRCNGRCFFCPTPQEEVSHAETQGVRFDDPKEYAEYVATFGYTGVGLSGGEPLLTPERTVGFARAVKRRLGDRVYLWLYTNGILATDEALRQAADAGVDEIRFDVAATSYRLDAVERACALRGPRVTIEIPAVPEEEETVAGLLPRLRDLGVRHLNLHQLRLTPHNRPNLVRRGYAFVPGPRLTVLGSELTALRLLRRSLESGVGVPINYCSFAFKSSFQKAGAGLRQAPFVAEPYEEVTAAGAIRRLSLAAAPEDLERLAAGLRAAGEGVPPWRLAARDGRLWLRAAAAAHLGDAPGRWTVAYHGTALRPAVTYRNPFKEIPIGKRRKVVVERFAVLPETGLTGADVAALAALAGDRRGALGRLPAALLPFERVADGLLPYHL
jgi:pyruvate formate-lyase activating enzyme-like uncharacterized protein